MCENCNFFDYILNLNEHTELAQFPTTIFDTSHNFI